MIFQFGEGFELPIVDPVTSRYDTLVQKLYLPLQIRYERDQRFLFPLSFPSHIPSFLSTSPDLL